MSDLLGQALLDYYHKQSGPDPRTETNISSSEEFPLEHLFRAYAQMSPLEQRALRECGGRVLDVGCGAGVHTLFLQGNGLEVCAIDPSPGAVAVCRKRGVHDVREQQLLELENEAFDTILLLMNGTGIFGTLEQTPAYLRHLRGLLSPGGQILIDSADLSYMYDKDARGQSLFPKDRYYGELIYTISYRGKRGKPFPWLFLDRQRFNQLAGANGLDFVVLAEGGHFDYLARLTPSFEERPNDPKSR